MSQGTVAPLAPVTAFQKLLGSLLLFSAIWLVTCQLSYVQQYNAQTVAIGSIENSHHSGQIGVSDDVCYALSRSLPTTSCIQMVSNHSNDLRKNEHCKLQTQSMTQCTSCCAATKTTDSQCTPSLIRYVPPLQIMRSSTFSV